MRYLCVTHGFIKINIIIVIVIVIIIGVLKHKQMATSQWLHAQP